MSTVLIIAPVVIGSWPAISGAAVGAAAALGFILKEQAAELMQEGKVTETHEEAEIHLEDSEIVAQDLRAGQEMVFTKDRVKLSVRRDERGRCVVCASGLGYTKSELTQMAEAFSQKLTQCFVYNKVMTELKHKNFNVVNEETMEDESVRIHVRRWVD